ncbi:heme-thiolate peroxidase [Dentipellis fragilis]|uniref:Heme-thiolate peroxidase n=1 Tax=Dentipellis fragilis TaxID=205917 RepID=A0A4Y9ZDW9_9AGAM|nr:heme-thiolate peroxidase [Dentipellis fragilis]
MTHNLQPHAFVPPTSSDSRSPCPALNALANHSYLAHDGRSLSALDLIRGLREGYNISLPLAALLSIVGVVTCGNGWRADLEDFAKHDRIEHDGSLTHADAQPGDRYAPIAVDESLLQHLLDVSSDARGLSFEDLVKGRAARDDSLAKPLGLIHAAIARGEVALTFETFRGDGEFVPKQSIQQWFGEDRLPDGWTRPSHSVGLSHTTKRVQEVGTLCKQLSKTE